MVSIKGIFATAITHGLKVGAFEEDDQVGLQVLRHDPDRGEVTTRSQRKSWPISANSREGRNGKQRPVCAVPLNHP